MTSGLPKKSQSAAMLKRTLFSACLCCFLSVNAYATNQCWWWYLAVLQPSTAVSNPQDLVSTAKSFCAQAPSSGQDWICGDGGEPYPYFSACKFSPALVTRQSAPFHYFISIPFTCIS